MPRQFASGSIVNGFSSIGSWHGLNQKPFTHFGKILPINVPTWYVPFLPLTIQIGPVHRNRSFPSMEPVFVWNTNTSFPIANCHSVCRRWCSTNAFVCRCFRSKSIIACIRLSSNIITASFQICSDYSSYNLCVAWIRSVGTWNLIGITTSKPKAMRKGVDLMMFNMKSYMPIKHYWVFYPNLYAFQ